MEPAAGGCASAADMSGDSHRGDWTECMMEGAPDVRRLDAPNGREDAEQPAMAACPALAAGRGSTQSNRVPGDTSKIVLSSQKHGQFACSPELRLRDRGLCIVGPSRTLSMRSD